MITIMSVTVIVLMIMIVWMDFQAVCTLQCSLVLAASVHPLRSVFAINTKKKLLSASAHHEKNTST